MFSKRLTLALLMILALPVLCYANTIGFIYQTAIDDTSWGLTGDVEANLTDKVKVGIEGQMQAGDVYLGNLDVAVTFGWLLDLRLESNNILKGYTLDSIGRTNDLGASLVVPWRSTEWSIGVFGKNGNPFSRIYKLANPSDPNSAELVDAGITLHDKSSLNVAIRGEFDKSVLNLNVEFGARLLLEVLGKGTRVHQGVLDIETGGSFELGLDWVIQAQIVGQKYGNIIEYDKSAMIGVERPF